MDCQQETYQAEAVTAGSYTQVFTVDITIAYIYFYIMGLYFRILWLYKLWNLYLFGS